MSAADVSECHPSPTICLNMIVRNEAHVITDTLASVARLIDRYVIVDTGSTDGTMEVIRSFFREAGIPGEIHERPWRDFGTNRSEALELCRGVADYAWVIDADDLLLGDPVLGELSLDSYDLRYGSGFVYWRKQIFRLALPWRYEGALHEFAACDVPFTTAQVPGRYHVESRRLGARSLDPQKYQRDAELLRGEVEKHPEDARARFYLAQSYLDAGDVSRALEHYRRRVELPGWDEETWYAAFRVGECLERLGSWPDALDAYLKAWSIRPSRAEPLYRIAVHYRTTGENALADIFARRASEIPFPASDRLFVWEEIYQWRIADELSIAAHYNGRFQESFDLCMSILDSEELEEGERERIMGNRDFAVARLCETDPPYPAAIVDALVSRKNIAGVVTLTITTCRRRDLFEKTINSFLANCTDLDRIGRWICIDDGSSEDDRQRMQQLYPFFEFVFKGDTDKGHARSMNRLLELVRTPFWLHLEDDWQFFAPLPYVSKAIAILEDDPTLGQALFNRNYAETLACRTIAGGIVKRTERERIRYRLHQHERPGTAAYDQLLSSFPAGARSVAYWPHFSLRPSVIRTEVLHGLGPFGVEGGHFEREFADRYFAAGWRSAFLDGVHALHIGRLTSESPEAKPNAYDLNEEPQFLPAAVAKMEVRVLNLDRRPDRWAAFQEGMRAAAGSEMLRRCQRVSAVDGRSLGRTPALEQLFEGNDFGWRRTFIGCALSHIERWEEAARAEQPTLIFEDDVRFAPGFVERLRAVRQALDTGHPSFDICFLGYNRWSGGAAMDGPRTLAPMPWDDYLGGLFAYVLSPKGARTLLGLVHRHGVQNGIDRFLHVHAAEIEALAALPPLATAEVAVIGDAKDTDIQHDVEPLGAVSEGRFTRVKLLGNGWTPEELCRDWNRMSQGNFRWNDLEVTWDDRDADFYVIVNYPRAGDRYDPARTIVLQMEPWCGDDDQTWGVKTWGEWSRPDPERFLQVRAHRTHLNTPFWQLAATYPELKAMTVGKTKTLATICSGKYFDPGHRKRVDFLKFLEEKDDDVVRLDVYGRENPHQFRWYAGPLPDDGKDAGLLPYRYFFAAENNREHNYITEKLWEPLLTETLCFYWGAPNVAEHIEARAFIEVDLDDFEKAFQTMKAAIVADEWSKRVDVIRREKLRVLDELQFFPMLERILRAHR